MAKESAAIKKSHNIQVRPHGEKRRSVEGQKIGSDEEGS